ncbi:MAG: CPBP family intramembrane metalloprotease [Pseudobutyrivibrio sp.]|nr:CPBP family intramembrane metalloprotease [Pseudobutyrivibrio sp.]
MNHNTNAIIDNKTLKIALLTAIPIHIVFYLLPDKSFGISSTDITSRVLLNVIYQLIMTVILILVLRKFLTYSWKYIKQIGFSNSLKFIWCGFLLALGISFTWNIIDYIFTGCKYDIHSVSEDNIREYTKAFPLLNSLLAIFVVPFTEECLYRGIILSFLNRINKYVAIIGTSAAFSLLHIFSTLLQPDISFISIILRFIYYFLFGLSLCLVYKKYNSLWICVGVHIVWNTFAQSILLIKQFIN